MDTNKFRLGDIVALKDQVKTWAAGAPQGGGVTSRKIEEVIQTRDGYEYMTASLTGNFSRQPEGALVPYDQVKSVAVAHLASLMEYVAGVELKSGFLD